jgi:hypothetical protein
MTSADTEAWQMRKFPGPSWTEMIEARRTRAPRKPWRRAGTRFTSLALICCGVGMLPWIVTLMAWLPATTQVSHWSTAWAGLDALEAIGLVTTGCLLRRADQRSCLAAAGTAMLLTADTWFDLMTAAPGAGPAISIVMAVCAELPMITLCGVLAIRTLPRQEA